MQGADLGMKGMKEIHRHLGSLIGRHIISRGNMSGCWSCQRAGHNNINIFNINSALTAKGALQDQRDQPIISSGKKEKPVDQQSGFKETVPQLSAHSFSTYHILKIPSLTCSRQQVTSY